MVRFPATPSPPPPKKKKKSSVPLSSSLSVASDFASQLDHFSRLFWLLEIGVSVRIDEIVLQQHSLPLAVQALLSLFFFFFFMVDLL